MCTAVDDDDGDDNGSHDHDEQVRSSDTFRPQDGSSTVSLDNQVDQSVNWKRRQHSHKYAPKAVSPNLKRKRDAEADAGPSPVQGRQRERQAEHEGPQQRRPSKADDRRWTEQRLLHTISQITQDPLMGAKAIHPSVSFVANSIVASAVPDHVFHTLEKIVALHPTANAWKLEFERHSVSKHIDFAPPNRRCTKGRLTITMPTHFHETFIPFCQNIANQLHEASFLPRQYPREKIILSGSTAIKTVARSLHPDASLAFFRAQKAFLVMEVAYSQKEANACHKAQKYILDTNGRIKIVILVIITKKSGERSASGSLNPASISLGRDKLSPDHDTVHVHVYKAAKRPPNTLTGDHPIDGLQVFPSDAVNDTFKITWADVNCGPWDKFRDRARLMPGTPEPSCDIDFSALVSMARAISYQPDGSDLYEAEDVEDEDVEDDTQGLTKEAFVNSPTPAVYLSGTSSEPEEEGKMHDPDYSTDLNPSSSLDSLASC